MSNTFSVIHNQPLARFEIQLDGLLCHLDYEQDGAVLALTHTIVPKPLEGRGLAGQLVAATLQWARQQGYRIRPVCSYVQAYMQRHPETQDLLV